MMKALILQSGGTTTEATPTVVFVGSDSDREQVILALNSALDGLGVAVGGAVESVLGSTRVIDVVIDGDDVTVGDTLDAESMVFVKHAA